MYEKGFENRLVDVTQDLKKHLAVKSLGKYCRYTSVALDPKTGCYYVYEVRFQAADREGWRCVGKTLEEAIREIGRR